MTARIRTKPSTYISTSFNSAGAQIAQNVINTTVAKMVDDNSPFRYDKYCRNVKTLWPYSGLFTKQTNGVSVEYSGFKSADQAYQALGSILPLALDQLAIDPLMFTANNGFELIPFLVDWDDLLRTFTFKFWKHLTYGSVTWGLVPLYSDISSLASSLLDLHDNKFSSELAKYATPVIFHKVQSVSLGGNSLPGHISSNTTKWNFEGTVRLNGRISLDTSSLRPDVIKLFLLADEIGLNPDFKTLWDVIPLSFVVDYFFPLGDLLESLHPRGWFNPNWIFTGTASLKGVLQAAPLHNIPFNTNLCTGYAGYDCYVRDPQQALLKKYSQAPAFSWTAPSARELFNVSYLSLLSKFEKKK